MNKLKLFEDKSGFYIDYIFTENNSKKCLRLSVDNDYFSFTLISPYEKLKEKYIITFNEGNPIFIALKMLLGNTPFVEILEEGSNEGKSIIIQAKHNNTIDLIFNLNNEELNIISVSITNVRLASPNVTFGKHSPIIENFKNKLHLVLLELKKEICKNKNLLSE